VFPYLKTSFFGGLSEGVEGVSVMMVDSVEALKNACWYWFWFGRLLESSLETETFIMSASLKQRQGGGEASYARLCSGGRGAAPNDSHWLV
jgi:hypothetical protein